MSYTPYGISRQTRRQLLYEAKQRRVAILKQQAALVRELVEVDAILKTLNGKEEDHAAKTGG